MSISVNNVQDWLEKNKHDFVPPICNKCMFSDQLKVFYVGGPNQRKDYHIEEGEEFFYQIKGDMRLDVVERGKFRPVHIKEGQMFMLPARIPHSPQRGDGTIGLVVERLRLPSEMDGLRYYMEDGSGEALFERWFHLDDVVKDLPPVVREYFSSDACKTGKPTEDSVVVANRPYALDSTTQMEEPLDIKAWLLQHAHTLRCAGKVDLFDPSRYKSCVKVLSLGKHELDASKGELFLMQLHGYSKINMNRNVGYLEKNFAALISDGKKKFEMEMTDANSACLCLQMPTPT